MRRLILIAAALTFLLLAGFWLTGGFDLLADWARGAQRDFQNATARALRRLKAGETGAILALMAVAFGYGLAHAAGPGHGKVLIGGYALGSRAGAPKLVGLSLAAGLAQATVAVALVLAGVLIIGWGREQLKGVAEDWFAPASALAIAALGLWLAVRGLRHLRRAVATDRNPAHRHSDAHDHPQDHGATCDHCGHSHGPTADEIEAVHDWRAAAALVGGVAIRPCTGALFLLVLTWQMGILWAGIAGAYAMGLGTAVITITAALGAALLREGLFAGLARSPVLTLTLPVMEIVAGLLIALIAITLAFAPL
jgi:ABC-type nickel/cobalt efflux system permease component RcnA